VVSTLKQGGKSGRGYRRQEGRSKGPCEEKKESSLIHPGVWAGWRGQVWGVTGGKGANLPSMKTIFRKLGHVGFGDLKRGKTGVAEHTGVIFTS